MNNSVTISYQKVLTLVACLLAVVGCSTGPKIFVNNVPNANIAGFKTYNYEQQLGTDESEGVRSALSQYMINAVDRELSKRGYMKADNPELLVNFNLTTKEKFRAQSSPTGGGYYGYRGYGGWGGYDTTITQYTEGTLTVALIDNTGEKKQLAWEGIAEGRMTDKARANLEEAVNVVIGDLFARYPYVAAGYVPQAETAANVN